MADKVISARLKLTTGSANEEHPDEILEKIKKALHIIDVLNSAGQALKTDAWARLRQSYEDKIAAVLQ